VEVPKTSNMRKLIVTITTITGSWLGWWLGDQFGLITAFILSMIGTGLGLYFGRRFVQF
jgi:hypothetical protein